MQPKDLLAVWAAPDNTRLTTKQHSFRLPVHVAAKIAALCEMYPKKNRTQIVADLLSSALLQVEGAFPKAQGRYIGRHPETHAPFFEDDGPGPRFRALVNKHYGDIERELGNEVPEPFYKFEMEHIAGEKE